MALDLPDLGEDLDLTLRQVTRQYPEQLARALLPPGTAVASVRWAETQAASRQRRLDRALTVVVKTKGKPQEHASTRVRFEVGAPASGPACRPTVCW